MGEISIIGLDHKIKNNVGREHRLHCFVQRSATSVCYPLKNIAFQRRVHSRLSPDKERKFSTH